LLIVICQTRESAHHHYAVYMPLQGGADITYATSAGIIYTINDLLDVDVKYKATWVDYEEGTLGTRDHFVYDTVTHGLIFGLNFKF